MKYSQMLTVVTAALALAPLGARAQQQQVRVDVSNIEVATMPTPDYNYDGDTKKLPSPKEWVEIEVEFEAESSAGKDFIDELEFSYYVVVADEPKTMVVQKVTHVNVPVKEKIYSNVFISPATIKKLTGSEATSNAVIAGVAVEVRFQGALVGGETTEKSGGKWWESRPQTPGLLLKKNETPFSLLWWDRYAEIKKDQ